MRSFWRNVVLMTCGLAALLIGLSSSSCGRGKKAAKQETESLEQIRKAADQGDAHAQVASASCTNRAAVLYRTLRKRLAGTQSRRPG